MHWGLCIALKQMSNLVEYTAYWFFSDQGQKFNGLENLFIYFRLFNVTYFRLFNFINFRLFKAYLNTW